MKKTIITSLGSLILGATGAVALQTDTVQVTDLKVEKATILQDNVESHSRLVEPPVWDTSVATAEEISQAYIKVAEKYNVTTNDLTASGGNLQTAIQVKLQAANLMCNK